MALKNSVNKIPSSLAHFFLNLFSRFLYLSPFAYYKLLNCTFFIQLKQDQSKKTRGTLIDRD